MAKGTDPKSLEELLSDTRIVGVAGVEIVLGLPTNESVADIRVQLARVSTQDTSVQGLVDASERFREWSKLATKVVAATLLIGDDPFPCCDERKAGQLITKLSVKGQPWEVFKTDLLQTALDLCGITLNMDKVQNTETEDNQDPPEQVP